jgi:flagellar basal-body rod protein FlgB
MDFARQPLFAMISQRLGWLTERQKVLAENVANVDTPDYKPRDLKQQSFEEMVRGASSMMSMSRTTDKHLDPGSLRGAGGGGKAQRQKGIETTLSGNSVTLDVELMKISESAQEHALATNLYKKQLNLFRTVLGRGGAP